MVESRPVETELGAVLAALRDGDEAEFTAIAERHRRELHVHCYRMLGSFHDAEDMVQEALLRAWRSRASFEGRSSFASWLYRIATNVCLSFLDRRPRRILTPDAAPAAVDGVAAPDWRPDLPWLEPYPDPLLAIPAAEEGDPDTVIVARETIELAYLVAIQHLPARQRAILILRDALGWSERETAALLETTVPSVKSALQRARSTMRTQLPSHRLDWAPAGPREDERRVLERFMAAYERADPAALVAILCEDARQTMPPAMFWLDGGEAIAAHAQRLLDGSIGEFRMVATTANRQPAAAAYLRYPGASEFRLSGLNVLRIEGGRIAEITSFSPALCAPFGLPTTL